MTYERIKKMKADAILLNAGRGTAVDCDALARALGEGHLFGAGLDVTDPKSRCRQDIRCGKKSGRSSPRMWPVETAWRSPP